MKRRSSAQEGQPVRRREFIAIFGGAAAGWAFAARAQEGERMRRIGVLVAYAESDPEMKVRLAALRQGLERVGWSEGRNIHIDVRFAPAGAGQEQVVRQAKLLRSSRCKSGPSKE